MLGLSKKNLFYDMKPTLIDLKYSILYHGVEKVTINLKMSDSERDPVIAFALLFGNIVLVIKGIHSKGVLGHHLCYQDTLLYTYKRILILCVSTFIKVLVKFCYGQFN